MSMHSAGLELTKLTYTRLEDNLIRHRGDRLHRSSYTLSCPLNCCGGITWVFAITKSCGVGKKMERKRDMRHGLEK